MTEKFARLARLTRCQYDRLVKHILIHLDVHSDLFNFNENAEVLGF